MAFYWAMGTSYPGQLAATYSTTLAPRATGAWHLPSGDSGGIPSVPAGFRGSVVITSDQPLAVNANTETTGNPVRVGTVRGVDAPDTTLRFPQVQKAYSDSNWDSFVVIQNTTGTSASATIRYYHPTGGEVAWAAQTQQSIPAYSSWIVHQSQNANLPSDWVGSAVVTSSQPLAGVAALYEGMSGASTVDFAHYGAQTVAATTVHVPKLVREHYGYSSGLTIQNAGTSATNVTIQYRFATYTFYQTLNGLQPGAARALFLPDVTELDDVDGWDEYWRSGTAVVTASQPVVAIANESYHGADARFQGRSVSYGAFAAGSGSTAIGFSQVTSRYYGYSGGVQVQNVGGATTTVTAVFSAPGFDDVTRQATVAPGAKADWFLPVDPDLWNWNGSVRVTASQPLVGIANNSFRPDVDDRYPIIYGDSFNCYESTDAN